MGEITTCPDCDHEVSERAVQCPHCGAPFRRGGLGFGQLAMIAGLGLMALILILATLLPKDVMRDTMPAAVRFLGRNPEMGTPVEALPSKTWADGLRQVVVMEDGRRLEFYEKAGQVVTVWDRSPGAGGRPIWGEAD